MAGAKTRQRKLRRVALVVESAVAPRRRMLAGVARYIHEHEPWAVYLKPFGVEKSLHHWLREWNGDGVIAAVAELEAEAVVGYGIPIVDVVGLHRHDDIPLVHTNDEAVGRPGTTDAAASTDARSTRTLTWLLAANVAAVALAGLAALVIVLVASFD